MIAEKIYTSDQYQDLAGIINKQLSTTNERYVLIRHQDQQFNPAVVDKYINLMSKYTLPITFYPFSEFIPRCNRVLGRPNPIVSVESGNMIVAIAVRSPNPAWFIIDRSLVRDFRFNEKLKTMFFEDYLFTLFENKLLPSNGIFIDIINSYKFFLTFGGKTPILDDINIEHDKKYMKERNVTLDNGTSQIVSYIKTKNHIY